MSQKLTHPTRRVLTALCVAALVACGGGGSPSSQPGGGTNTNGGTTGGTGGNNTGATVSFMGLTIAPGGSTVVVTAGYGVQLTARDRYSDDTTRDRTAIVSWSSSDTATATVSDAAGSKGSVLAVAPGVATITAHDAETNATAIITVVVTEALLESVAVTATDTSTPAGYGVQFTATATYSDGVTADVTDLATWTSSDDTIATVSNDPVTAGVVTGVAQGNATITATMPGKQGSASIAVTAAVIRSIEVTAPTTSIPKGVPVQMKATATFSDSTTQDVTGSVTWSTSDAAVASVSNADGSAGVVTGLQVGNVTVTATHESATASLQLSFNGAVLQSLYVDATPSRHWSWAGTSTRFFAYGRFDDGTTLDITREVTWSVSAPQLVAFSSVAGKTNVAWANVWTASPVVFTATDPRTGVSNTFSWSEIKQRHRQVTPLQQQ